MGVVRCTTLTLAAMLAAAPSAAYQLRFWPNPAYVEQARVVVTLDYFDAYDCPEGLTRIQSSKPPVFRFGLKRQPCAAGAGPQHSVSATLPALPAGVYSVEVIEPGVWPEEPFLKATFRVFEPSLCRPSESVLCLHDGRFEVQVDWRDFADGQGYGRPVPQDPERPFHADSGLFWFFDPDNLELMVKVLDGCGLNQRFWVFLAPASTVAYDVTVTDHVTGAVRTYHNEAGNTPALTADTDALPCS